MVINRNRVVSNIKLNSLLRTILNDRPKNIYVNPDAFNVNDPNTYCIKCNGRLDGII